MGSLCGETPSLAQDLKITIHDTCLVFPAQETEQKSMFLSNIDKVLNFQVQTVHFFPSNKDLPPYVVAEKLKSTLKKLLVPYHFLAGRFKLNPKTGRLEIDCNSAGAGFVVASSEYELDEIGDLVYPNPGFARLAPTTMESLGDDDQPLFTMQVTSFRCGGFAMGIATNHATFDGLSFKLFLDNLAALAADKPLVITPCNDRQLLAARSPPRVTFSHPELIQLEALKPTVFDDTHEDLDFKIFRLTPEVITNLQEKATGGPLHSNLRVSRFNAITALLWRCKALSSCEIDTTLGTLHGFERESTILYAVDIRPRLTPPLPPSYTGNAVLTAYATTTCKEILEGPFSRLVDMISEGARRMTDEFARSVIDWGELYTGIPHGEVLVSSWWRLGFAEVEYPWGRPKYSSPVVNHRKDIILLFPDIDDKDGVNVLVSLPRKEMIKFQGLFEKFLT